MKRCAVVSAVTVVWHGIKIGILLFRQTTVRIASKRSFPEGGRPVMKSMLTESHGVVGTGGGASRPG
jgi:hypothetical protein